MVLQLCKTEERHKLRKYIHLMNQVYDNSFVFYWGWKQKLIKFPSKRKSSFWEPVFVASHSSKNEERYWLTIIWSKSQTEDSASSFYSVQTEKQNRTSSDCAIQIFPSHVENKKGHNLKTLRTMYRMNEGISLLIGRYQSKETKPKFVKIWMPA